MKKSKNLSSNTKKIYVLIAATGTITAVIIFGPLLLLTTVILLPRLPQVKAIPILESRLVHDKYGVPKYRSALFSETHYDPEPYIDTIFSKDFTPEKFKQIASGMTKKQVITLLGEPLTHDAFGIRNTEDSMKILMPSDPIIADCWRYSTDGKLGKEGDTSWYSFNVCFEKNLVIGKHVNEFTD